MSEPIIRAGDIDTLTRSVTQLAQAISTQSETITRISGQQVTAAKQNAALRKAMVDAGIPTPEEATE